MYEGLIYYGGSELVNHTRTRAYVDALGLNFFNDVDECGDLTALLGKTYEGPGVDDDTPWYDPARPESTQFAGIYVLQVDGAERSTLTRGVYPRLGNGATVGLGTYGPRTLVFRAILLGSSEEGVHLGVSWLSSVLEGRHCGQSSPREGLCGGFDMDYLDLCPGACGCDAPVCDATCWQRAQRHMYEVFLTNGVHTLQDACVGNGYIAEVEFTLVAGNPFHYGDPLSARQYPFAFTYGVVKDTFMPSYQTWRDLNPAGYTPWSYGELWNYLWDQANPAPATVSPMSSPGPAAPMNLPPLVDPDCGTPPAFPTVPQSDIYCGGLHSGNWKRTTYRMSAQDVSHWMKQVPIVTLSDAVADHHDVRLRFTPEGGSPDADFVSEFYVTWLPKTTTMELNAPRDTVLLERAPGYYERAEHLIIMDSRGAPLRWPTVDCGGSWIITVDVPSTDTALATLDVNLSLVTIEP